MDCTSEQQLRRSILAKKHKLIGIQAEYPATEQVVIWFVRFHVPALLKIRGVSFVDEPMKIQRRGQEERFVLRTFFVDEEHRSAYFADKELSGRIREDALANGMFSESAGPIETYSLPDEDDEPSGGHNPESRSGGHIESRGGFGGERG